MKHFTKLFVGILFLILGGTQSGMAQSGNTEIEWTKYAVAVGDLKPADYVYLYNVTNKKFVHGGGKYGMQAILNDRGIRFQVTAEGDAYYLESAIYNSTSPDRGRCIGINHDVLDNDEIYLDRARDEYSQILFEKVGDGNVYEIRTKNAGPTGSSSAAYFSYDSSRKYIKGVYSNSADEWCLIKKDIYEQVVKDVASQQGRYNITGLIGNSRFLRNVSDEVNKFWSVDGLDYENDDYCTTIDKNFGDGNLVSTNYAQNYGAFGCVEIGKATGKFYQKIGGLKKGLYLVTAQAFFDLNDECTYMGGAYSEDNHADASNAYLYANESKTLIPALDDTEQNVFDTYVGDLKDAAHVIFVGDYRQYFRRNVAAAYFLAHGNQFEPDETFHMVMAYVSVGDDGTLELGVSKEGLEGRVYVDNFSLYLIGENGIGLDAYEREVTKVDPYKYNKEYSFHLSRKFVLDEWNAITLPMDVEGYKIKEAFGQNAKLCKLEGVNPNNKDQILFTTVDLEKKGEPAIVRGECYLIKVTSEPECGAYEPYPFIRKEEGTNTKSEDVEFKYGNVYTINGVSCPEGMRTPDNNTVSTKDGKLSYTYFYHRPGTTQGATPVPAGSYVMSGGKMYHIPQPWDGLLGTCWYITDLTTSGNSKVLAIEGEGGTTDINGIVTEVPGDKAMEGVYNINGQKVADGTSLEGLPKGIYIVNGKKHVVK